MSSYQYRKSHCGDKTVVRSSYLHNGISYIGKMSSLYWIRAQVAREQTSSASGAWRSVKKWRALLDWPILAKTKLGNMFHSLRPVTRICVIELGCHCSSNGLSPVRWQAITWNGSDVLLTGPLGTVFNEIWINLLRFSLKNGFENVVWKMVAMLFRSQWVSWYQIVSYKCYMHSSSLSRGLV